MSPDPSDLPADREKLDDLFPSEDGIPSDAELITAVRAGDEQAFGVLWQRHEAAALRLARQIANPSNAEDLVSESFARLLRVLRQGGGPDGAFRPYLFSTLRRLNIDNARSYSQRVTLTGDDDDLESEPASSAAEVAAAHAENSAAWRAWASLPESSRTLLWHLVVEEETPAQIAPLIGTSANGVSSRAVRARERLRQAFLQQHVADAVDEKCRWTRSRLGEYVRDALSARDRAAVQAHLDECDTCPAVLFEISDVNQTLRVVIAPIILGGAGLAAYLGAAGGAAGTHAGALGSLKFFGGRVRATATRGILLGVGAVVVVGAITTAATMAASSSARPEARQLTPIAGVVATTSSTAVSPPPVASPTPSPISTSSTPATAPAPPPPSPTRSASPRPTKKATPTKSVAVVVSVLPVVPSVPTTAVVAPTTPVPPTSPPATVTITGQTHDVRFGVDDDPMSPGTVDVTMPTGWTIDPNGITITSPTDGSWSCSVTSATTAHCDIASPIATVDYAYTIDVTGPSADLTSLETITYTNGAFTTTINPPASNNP